MVILVFIEFGKICILFRIIVVIFVIVDNVGEIFCDVYNVMSNVLCGIYLKISVRLYSG